MESKLVRITPELATALLEKNKNNRAIREKTLTRYIDDMQNGRWCLTHQGVALFEDGSVADGQHRLMAVKISGVSVDMMLSVVEKKAAIGIDVHASRTANDAILISGGPVWIDRRAVSISRILMDRFAPSAFPYSAADIEDFCIKHEAFIRPAVGLVLSHTRGSSAAGFIACLACALCGGEKIEKIRRIVEIMTTGEISCAAENAIIRLREYTRNDLHLRMWNKDKRSGTAKRTQRAILAFCSGESLGKLYEPLEFSYPMVGDSNSGDEQ